MNAPTVTMHYDTMGELSVSLVSFQKQKLKEKFFEFPVLLSEQVNILY